MKFSTKTLKTLLTRYAGKRAHTLHVAPDPIVPGVLALKAEFEGLPRPVCFLLKGEHRLVNLEEVQFAAEPAWVEQ